MRYEGNVERHVLFRVHFLDTFIHFFFRTCTKPLLSVSLKFPFKFPCLYIYWIMHVYAVYNSKTRACKGVCGCRQIEETVQGKILKKLKHIFD